MRQRMSPARVQAAHQQQATILAARSILLEAAAVQEAAEAWQHAADRATLDRQQADERAALQRRQDSARAALELRYAQQRMERTGSLQRHLALLRLQVPHSALLFPK